MLPIIAVLACISPFVTAYPTDSPISEPPNIVLASPDDIENAISTFGVSEMNQDDSGCESEEDTLLPSVPEKRADDQDQPPPRRCSSQNFIRLGRGGKTNDNFIRFGRGKANDNNFIRFGRGKESNFIRFGRDRSDNFIRFGRGRTDSNNFIRLGRGKDDNFIRFGKGKSDNFIRFGRGKEDNFIRFGKGMRDNFVRFGRDEMPDLEVLEPEVLDTSDDKASRVSRGGKSDSNFIRFGRAKNNNFIRLGRNYDDDQQRVERSKDNNFVRFGRNIYDEEEFLRPARSGGINNLRRGKLTDRNFIRLGRSGPQYFGVNGADEDNDDRSSSRPGRSSNQNFIRLGKRSEQDSSRNPLLRFGRDVEQIGQMPVISAGDETKRDSENKTSKTEYEHSRKRRSLSNDDETAEDSSDYPVLLASNAYEDSKIADDSSKIPFGYYSPLTSGIPNYILGPELAVLAPLSSAESSLSKKAKGMDHNRNYIRLG